MKLALAFALITIASAVYAESPALPDGTLVMHDLGPGKTTIYCMQAGQKDPITSWATFTKQGWKLSEVRNLSQPELDLIPTGPVCVMDGMVVAHEGPGGTTYKIENGQKLAIPNPETFAAMGYSWDELVRIPDSRLASFRDGPAVPPQPPNQSHEDTSCFGVVEICNVWHYDSLMHRVDDSHKVCGGCVGFHW